MRAPVARSASAADTAVAEPSASSSAAGGLSPNGDVERDRLVAAMEKAGWVQAKAARILGLTPRQIGYALKKHGIEIRRF